MQDVVAESTTYGKIAASCCGMRLPLRIMEGVRGFYIGTQEDWMPISRESKEYWVLKEDAELALATGQWTQRLHP